MTLPGCGRAAPMFSQHQEIGAFSGAPRQPATVTFPLCRQPDARFDVIRPRAVCYQGARSPAPRLSPLNTECDMPHMELISFANELRTRAEEILVRAAGSDDPELQGMMRVIAAGYQKLARRVEQRVREAETT